MIAGVGVSAHPAARDATGEVIGQLLDRVGPSPELLCLFVSGHEAEVDEVVAAVRTTLTPGVLVGTTARTLVGGARELEGRAAIAALGVRAAGTRGLRIATRSVERGTRLEGLDPRVLAEAHSLVVLADPFSFPTVGVLEHLGHRHPHLTVVGAITSAGRRAGANRLFLDDDVATDGAVAVALDGPVAIDTVVSPACRPIGEPFTVTDSEAGTIRSLGGRPATERLRDVLAALDPQERSLAADGLQAGLVVDERRESFGVGDFVIRAIRGIDRERGAILVGDHLPVGSIFQFQVRDADSARADLVDRLVGRRADAALLFTCDGRG
ncbi:MAG: FIST N-terminal domain-containing protein, partial [Actinomycetota bacterium]